MFVPLALRADDHSAFGANFNRVLFPKASLSWVLSDEPWFHVPFVGSNLGELRFRTAYGRSGKPPVACSSTKTSPPPAGPVDAAAVTPTTIGNPSLGPEKGKEL